MRFNTRVFPRQYPPDFPNVATTTSSSGEGGVDDCGCGGCLSEGTISDCAALGEDAAYAYRFPLPTAFHEYFGEEAVVVHDTDCTWVSATFEGVDIGNGAHDYFFKMLFTGKGIEHVTLTLEDET